MSAIGGPRVCRLLLWKRKLVVDTADIVKNLEMGDQNIDENFLPEKTKRRHVG